MRKRMMYLQKAEIWETAQRQESELVGGQAGE